MEEISQLDNADEIMKLPNSWEEKGIEKGIERGIKKVALEMIKEDVPIELIKKVTNLDEDEIEWLREKLNE